MTGLGRSIQKFEDPLWVLTKPLSIQHSFVPPEEKK
jgi:hypothetical protein